MRVGVEGGIRDRETEGSITKGEGGGRESEIVKLKAMQQRCR